MVNKKHLNRAEFAELAGVTGGAVTKACKGALGAACVGKSIDVDHPEAIKYLNRAEVARPHIVVTGIDPLYEDAVDFCVQSGKFSARGLAAGIGIGRERATKIIKVMEGAGLISGKGEAPKVIRRPHERVIKGHTVKNNTKKSEALNNLNTAQPVQHEVPEDIEAFAEMSLRGIITRFGSDTAFVDWLKALKEIENISDKRLKNAQTKGALVNRELVKLQIIEPINSAHIKLLSDGAKTLSRQVCSLRDSGEGVEEIEKFISEHMSSFIRPVKSKIAKALKNV